MTDVAAVEPQRYSVRRNDANYSNFMKQMILVLDGNGDQVSEVMNAMQTLVESYGRFTMENLRFILHKSSISEDKYDSVINLFLQIVKES